MPVKTRPYQRAREVVRSLWLGRLRYLILGPLEVRDGDAGVALRGGQQRKLLAILLLHAGKAVSSDRLIEELWDGKPPETAAKALQGYVSSLRKQLGPETVETVSAGYRLDVAPEDLDAHRFEELLAEARPLERAPAVAKLREALALWRGPALADFAYDDFARTRSIASTSSASWPSSGASTSSSRSATTTISCRSSRRSSARIRSASVCAAI